MPPSKNPSIDRDGWLLSAESVPILGYLLALFDVCNEDFDRALRAFAKCTNTSLVAATSVVGGIVGGGPVGAGLGAASATPLAMWLQNFISENIRDPAIRNGALVDLTPEAVLGATISNGLFAGIGAHVNGLLADILGPILTKLGAVRLLAQGAYYLFRLFF